MVILKVFSGPPPSNTQESATIFWYNTHNMPVNIFSMHMEQCCHGPTKGVFRELFLSFLKALVSITGNYCKFRWRFLQWTFFLITFMFVFIADLKNTINTRLCEGDVWIQTHWVILRLYMQRPTNCMWTVRSLYKPGAAAGRRAGRIQRVIEDASRSTAQVH